MKYIISYSILLFLGALIFFGCAEPRHDITGPPEVLVHGEGAITKASDNFHGQWLRKRNWDLAVCAECHGSNYAGGTVNVSCLKCHTEDNGPEACNTCHGDFSDLTNIAPPQGTNNETSTTAAAVGAHQVHLYGITISENVACSECHSVPAQFASAGHIDETARAEVIFGEYENYNDSVGTPKYNFENNTCENSYCHGNFKFDVPSGVPIYGNNFAPKWNVVDGSQAKCGTCHGEIDADGALVTPLPNGHPGEFTLTQCWNCHYRVVNAEGDIIDKTLHINGERDVF